MSQHSSLRGGRGTKRHRSVLKRFERLQALQEKGEWKEGGSIFGLPKVKTLRIKVKKEKAAEAPVAAAAEGAVGTPATPAAGTVVTPKAGEKGAPKTAAPKEAPTPKKEGKKERG